MRQRAAAERGNAIIEFVLSCGLLFAIFSGVFQFGYAFYLYNVLENAVTAGARYASLRTYDSSSATPSASYLTAVRNVVVYGDPAGGQNPVAPGLDPSAVAVTVSMEAGVPRRVRVAIASYKLDAAIKVFQLTGKPFAEFPYVGRFAPPT